MKKENNYTKSIGIGIVLGSVIGVLTDNIGLWLSLGIVFGAGYAKTQQVKKEGDETDDSE